jgi:hypothetical protein
MSILEDKKTFLSKLEVTKHCLEVTINNFLDKGEFKAHKPYITN